MPINNTKWSNLSLDRIFGYRIRPNLSLSRQPIPVKFNLIMAIIMFMISILSGIISIMTYKSKKIQEFGCEAYLLS